MSPFKWSNPFLVGLATLIGMANLDQEHNSPTSNDNPSEREESLLDDALKSLSGSLLGTPESSKVPEMLGILEPTGYVNWLYPSPPKSSPD
jgi:hypothetical protein